MENKENGQSVEKRTSYKSLLIENIKYRTILTEKYKSRKQYERKNEKLIYAFIPGTILEVIVKPNKKVQAGEKLLTLEAMKMNNAIVSPMDGVIKSVNVKEGDKINKSTILVELK